MSQDYSGPEKDPSHNMKSSLSPYYSDLALHFNIANTQTPFESIQKVYNFINRRKKHDPSSHKSMQFPPNTKFYIGNTPLDDKLNNIQEKKNNRSISRPKSGENVQHPKSLQQSRSSNSISIAKSTAGQSQNYLTFTHNKQNLNKPTEQSVVKVSKYLLPKAKGNDEVSSYSFEREKEESRIKKVEEPNKANSTVSKELPLKRNEKQRQGSYLKNFTPNLPREEIGSLSFSSFRNRNNFSHSNSIVHENSHLHLIVHEDPSSSEFNFESPIPTNRAAQEKEFSDLRNRFSPREQNQTKSKEKSKERKDGLHKHPIFQNLGENTKLERIAERLENEDNPKVITKSSIDGTRVNIYEKILPPDGKGTKAAASNMQSLDLKKLNNLYEDEQHKIQSHSSFSMNPDVSIRTTDPTYRGKMNQNNYILVEDSIDNRNISNFQSNNTMFETSHFNNNLIPTPAEKDERGSRKPSDLSAPKDQFRQQSETNFIPNEEKAKKISTGSHPVSYTQLEKKASIKNITKVPSKQEQIPKASYSPNQIPNTNKSPQLQTSKGLLKNLRPITEPGSENISQMRFLEGSQQTRMVSSPNFSKMERIYEVQHDIRKLQLFCMNGKKNHQSLTPNPSSRNSRINSRVSHSKEQGKPRFLNPAKAKEIKSIGGTKTIGDYSPNVLDKHEATGPIIERIKNQTKLKFNAYNDKFHVKSQSLGFQELQQNKSFQSFQTQSSHVAQEQLQALAGRKLSQTKSQDYNVNFSLMNRKDYLKRDLSQKESKFIPIQSTTESLNHSQLQNPQSVYQHHQPLTGMETFNKGNLKLTELNLCEIASHHDELLEHLDVMNNDEDIYKSNQNHSKNLFEISCLHNDSLSHALDDSLKINKSIQQLSKDSCSIGNTSCKDLKEPYGGFEVLRAFESSRNNISRDNTARSNFEKQIRDSILDVKIDEQEDEEESVNNKDSKPGFLNFLELQIPRGESEKKLSRIAKEYKENKYYDRILRNPFDHKYEFKPSFMVDWEGHKNTVTSIVKDTTKNIIWSGSKDATIMAWVVRDFLVGLDPRVSNIQRENSKTVLKSKKGIECLMSDEGNQLIFVGGSDHDITALNSTTGELVRKFKEHQGGVYGITKLGHSAFLSCSGDQTVKKWDLHKGVCVQTWKEHHNRVTSVLYDRAKFAHSFISCSAEGNIKVWDMRSPKSVATFTDHELDVTSLTYVSSQSNIASGSFDKTVKVLSSWTSMQIIFKIWDLNMRAMLYSFDVGSKVNCLAHCEKTDKIVVGSDQLKIIHIEDGFDVETCEDKNAHTGSIRSLLIDNELDVLYTGSVDNMIKVSFGKMKLILRGLAVKKK